MEQKLCTEILPLYKSKNNNSYSMRFRIRLSDQIDTDALRNAVDSTMKRYPYFCVRLLEKGDEFVFADNQSPVVIADAPGGQNLMRSNPITK